jgi:cell wall-associated NlpC family hydrolase
MIHTQTPSEVIRRRVRALALTVLVVAALATAACAPKNEGPIADLRNLTQDAGAYHGRDPDTPLISPEAQAASYTDFLHAHFAPWSRARASITTDEAYWGLAAYGKDRIYGENTLPRDPQWLTRLGEYARRDQYPSMSRRAIAVTNADMRVLPTLPPSFHDPSRAGEGFPFDIMQNSLVLAGTPLLATHTSADRAWVLVESRFTFGWVRATDIAWVDDGFEKFFRTGSYGAITRDDVPVLDNDGNYRFTTHIGAILPILDGGFGGNGIAFVIPVRDQHGQAVAQVAFLPESVARRAPVPATPANFTRLINAMLGRPYGWGGLYEGRDCSQAVMDLMAACGITLPRNSGPQSKIGEVVDLAGLDRQSKKQAIIDRATPFLTLVRKPGHIMLYLGQHKDEPVIFHAVWGLKTMTGDKPGRKIIGGAVITTLEPGLELPDLVRPGGIILETVTSINTLSTPTSTDGN